MALCWMATLKQMEPRSPWEIQEGGGSHTGEDKRYFQGDLQEKNHQSLWNRFSPFLLIDGGVVFRTARKSWMKEVLGMASGRSKASGTSNSGIGTSQIQYKKYFKGGEIRIIKIPLVVKCAICASFVTFYFEGAL